MESKNVWDKYEEDELSKVFAFNEGYKNFISICKTERECVTEAIRIAESYGYRSLETLIKDQVKLKPGDKVYANNMDKSIALYMIGRQPMETGMNILGAHIDSPRLDIKQNPLYEDTDIAFLDTHYYGGIKKYQWVTLPLAIHGVVVKKDGTKVNIVIGEKEDDPVVGVSDLLVHLSGKQLDKKANVVIEGEDLNVCVGSYPAKDGEKDKAKTHILHLLKDKYDIEEDDFLSAELEVVPAGRARDYGIDRSMVMGYGQDDRACAYTSLMAMVESDNLEQTAACLLVDKEEIGSVGASSMHSNFFENTVAEIMVLNGEAGELKLRRALRNSKMLSSDVSAAYDPNYPAVMEKKNSAYFAHGLVFNKYTGARGKSNSNDANAEYMAYLRGLMEKHDVVFQTAELGKVDEGGGGTIAYILANYGMEVIDSGIALHNMHAPWEISSKADVYEAMRGYKAFLLG